MQPLSTEEVLREAARALAAGDAEAITTLYAEDAVFEEVPGNESYRGRAAIRSMFEALFSLPHSGFRVESIRSAEGWGALQWVWFGRTRSTDVSFEVRGASILEVAGPKVTRETIYYDPAPARR